MRGVFPIGGAFPSGGVILAGGGGRRLGGVLKPAIPIGGISMIDRVVAALTGCELIIVVGPPALTVTPVVRDANARAGKPLSRIVRVQESPPGGGPVAGIGAAFGALHPVADPVPGGEPRDPSDAPAPPGSLVAIVGGDLPLLTAADITVLVAAMADDDDGSIYVDETGRPQWLCGVWRTDALTRRLDTFGEFANGSLRALFGPMQFAEVGAGDDRPPPYFDCDTVDDIRQAEEWLRDDGA